MGLKEKAVKGIFWSMMEKFGHASVRFIIGIILARLLSPEDYGLLGMIIFFYELAFVLLNAGFGNAYIQKKDADETDENTVFFINFALSFLLYLILFAFAPLISRFYEQPILIKLLRVMGLVLIINSFNIIQNSRIIKKINFKASTIVHIGAYTLSGIIGIIAAYKGMGVWSLIIQRILAAFFRNIGFLFVERWFPSFKFSYESFKSLFGFGSKLMLSSVLNKIFDNLYIMVIGKIYPLHELGLYTKAKQLQRQPTENITTAFGSVTFPVFSRLQDDPLSLKNAVKKTIQSVMFIMIPIMVIMIIFAEPIVLLLLTEKWIEMVPLFQLLCGLGILYPLHAINLNVLKSIGRSDLTLKLSIIKIALKVLNLFITYRFGIKAIIIGEIILSVNALFINTYYNRKFIRYSIFNQIRDTLIYWIFGIILGLIGFIFNYFSFDLNHVNVFMITFLSVILFYLGLNLTFNRKFIIRLLQMRSYFISR